MGLRDTELVSVRAANYHYSVLNFHREDLLSAIQQLVKVRNLKVELLPLSKINAHPEIYYLAGGEDRFVN